MSPLTKILVVLMVILSIILAAGTVVWVNRQASFAKELNTTHAQLTAARAEASAARDREMLASGALDHLRTEMQNQLQAKQQEINTLRATVTDRDSQLAQLNSNLIQVSAASKSATDALTVAQKTVDQQNQAIADLRNSQKQLEQRSSEQSFAINTLTNKYEVTNKESRDFQEQVAQLQSDNKNLRDTLRKAGVSQAGPNLGPTESLLPLQGVVQSKQTISGVPYATISIGSAQQVTPGMRFRVVDPNSNQPFLGYLIVDRTEPNQAIGRLEGPRINEVRPGTQVRTQLNG